MAKPMNNTGNPVDSTDPADLEDNARVLDRMLNSSELSVISRLNLPIKTLAGMKEENDEIVETTRQNLIPLSRQYMSVVAALADIANIPAGSTTYVRSLDGSSLADEYVNNAGTLVQTGRRMPSQTFVEQVNEIAVLLKGLIDNQGDNPYFLSATKMAASTPMSSRSSIHQTPVWSSVAALLITIRRRDGGLLFTTVTGW